jgi:hypothetical protein
VHVTSADCSSLIYDCGIVLLAVAHEDLKCVDAATCFQARKTILSAWGSDFRHSKLREGSGRYGEEFSILNEIMTHGSDESAGSIGISGTDIVAVGYVAAAAARRSLACLVANSSSSSSSSHRSLFCAALSTFFRALFMCDNAPGSIDSLKEAAAR